MPLITPPIKNIREINKTMVALKTEPLTDNLSIGQLAKYDSKANMLDTFRLIGVGVTKSWDKSSLASCMDMVFEQTPALFANILPKDERNLLAKLLECKQVEYATCPVRKGRFLMLQELHLVVTYRDGDTWHLYMPDSIRQRLNSMFKEDLKLYPELEEMHNIFEQLTEKRDYLFRLMDNTDPDTLSPEQAAKMNAEVDGIAKFIADAKPRLKKIETYLHKNTDTKLDQVWMDLEHIEMYMAIVKATLTLRMQGETLPKPKPKKQQKPVHSQQIAAHKTEGMHELTLKVQLEGTPIYRTFKVIDRCSLFELNMLIQFCYDWNEMKPFNFTPPGGYNLTITRRLSSFGLEEGATLIFNYDVFQDNWKHVITIEKVEPYTGKEDDYEPVCVAGYGPDPGEGAGGNAWVKRNFAHMVKNKRKYSPFSKSIINDSFHFWWTAERHWWIQDGTIKYSD